MQDGVLLIPRDDEAVLWVRRSHERARGESEFRQIKPMASYRDATAGSKHLAPTLFVDAEVVPVAVLERFRKYFPAEGIRPLDLQAAKVRAVKSPFELCLMEQAGEIHRRVLEEDVPRMLSEGMSEAALATGVYSRMVELGHQGVVRFNGFNIEVEVGQIGFGDSSIHPTSFNGPGGCQGMSAAAPVLGNRDRRLRLGELVFIDMACGVDGYQSDKTMQYMFGTPQTDEVIAIHRECVAIQDRVAAMLKPGVTPASIHASVMESLPPDFLDNFMGFGNRRVNFLGHGIGLAVDEYPVITPGFEEPLEEGMVLAVEPKKGIAGVGMVGTENTYVVTPEGGRSITGNHPGMIPVPCPA
jgi:Xaa-Pro aminopeptidase